MKKFYLLVPLFFISYILFAENTPYVITSKNDTIKCAKVKGVFLGKGIKYKVKSSDDFKTANMDSVKEYMLSGDSLPYRSVTLEKESQPLFLRVIENGKICLYEAITYSYGAYGATTITTRWYASKNNAPAFFLKTTALNIFEKNQDTRKKLFSDMISDDPSVLAMFKADDSFSFKSLRKYVHEYNRTAPPGK